MPSGYLWSWTALHKSNLSSLLVAVVTVVVVVVVAVILVVEADYLASHLHLNRVVTEITISWKRRGSWGEVEGRERGICLLSALQAQGWPMCYNRSAMNAFILLLLLYSQLALWGSLFLVTFLCMWPFFFNPNIEVTFCLRGWCMLGVFFVAGIHPSRTGMSGSFESMQWNACVHRLDLGLYSHPKEFLGNGVRTHVISKGKIPSTGGSEEGQTRNTASRRQQA